MAGQESNGLRQRSVDPSAGGQNYGATQNDGTSQGKLVISDVGKAMDKRLDQHET